MKLQKRSFFALFAVLYLVYPAPAQVPNPVSLAQVVDANHIPSPQMVADAAVSINGASPSAIPVQTIIVGGFDGATGDFYFNLPGVYPPGLPDFKKCQTIPPQPPSPPGCVPPRYMAEINSFNVKYAFKIVNRPPDLSISIQLPDASGQIVRQSVPIDASGIAFVSFHPYWLQNDHAVTFTGTFQSVHRAVTALFSPYLKPQLGAFVVKHLLLAIVYEPPGNQSSSSIDFSKTTGTTWSFDFTGGRGLVDRVDTGSLLDTVKNIASGADGALQVLGMAGWAVAGSVAPYVAAAGKVAQVMNLLQGSQATTTTTVYTKGQSNSSGWSITVEQSYGTGGLHRYPGHGDKFVFLDDVLFVYTVANNRVQLAPVAFTQARSMTVDELQAQAPELAQKYGPLDLVLNPPPPTSAVSNASPPAPIAAPGGTIPSGSSGGGTTAPLGGTTSPSSPGSAIPRLSYFSTPVCEISCPSGGCNGLDLTDTQYSATGTSQTTTQTTFIVDTPSLMQSMLGENAPDQYYTTTYTTSTQDWQKSATGTSIVLGCPNFPTAHYVDLYIDNAFGTFLSILGPEVPPEAGVAGTVVDRSGQPAPDRQVALALGTKNYLVFSDRQGKFSIPLDKPSGKGVVIVGKETTSVDFSHGPVLNITLNEAGRTGVGPCCLISSVNAANNVVTAKVSATGQSFQFMVKDSSLLHSLKIGQGVFANFKTRQVSVNGKDVCCQIISSAIVRLGAIPSEGAPADQKPAGQGRSSGSCCKITAINQQTGIITAKVNETNQLFEFNMTNRTLRQSLRVGQPIYANFPNKQVSLDGKTTCCMIIGIGPTPSVGAVPRP